MYFTSSRAALVGPVLASDDLCRKGPKQSTPFYLHNTLSNSFNTPCGLRFMLLLSCILPVLPKNSFPKYARPPTGMMVIIKQPSHPQSATILPGRVLMLPSLKGNIRANIRSRVMTVRKKTDASLDNIARIPASLHRPLRRQLSACTMYSPETRGTFHHINISKLH